MPMGVYPRKVVLRTCKTCGVSFSTKSHKALYCPQHNPKTRRQFRVCKCGCGRNIPKGRKVFATKQCFNRFYNLKYKPIVRYLGSYFCPFCGKLGVLRGRFYPITKNSYFFIEHRKKISGRSKTAKSCCYFH